MAAETSHALTTIEEVRAIVGELSPMTAGKIFPQLDPVAIDFVKRAPFLLLATVDADGKPDVSPKGDGPGFVLVEDEGTLFIPERKGNRLCFSLTNILATGRVALIFLVPGTEETLRVHGRCELTDDPAILARLVERGQPALLAMRVTVEQCFFHCAKAFKRSHLWDASSWGEKYRVSFGKVMAPKLSGGDELEKAIDEMVEENYRTEL